MHPAESIYFNSGEKKPKRNQKKRREEGEEFPQYTQENK